MPEIVPVFCGNADLAISRSVSAGTGKPNQGVRRGPGGPPHMGLGLRGSLVPLRHWRAEARRRLAVSGLKSAPQEPFHTATALIPEVHDMESHLCGCVG